MLLRRFEVTFRFFGLPRDAAGNEGCFAAGFLRPFSVSIKEATDIVFRKHGEKWEFGGQIPSPGGEGAPQGRMRNGDTF